ncbi:hypothetical protein BGZ73_007323 [Actinomortierella ambigua]|nr:hypothetical protein BGZ73_007323 [Actinomortierella ambigua]
MASCSRQVATRVSRCIAHSRPVSQRVSRLLQYPQAQPTYLIRSRHALVAWSRTYVTSSPSTSIPSTAILHPLSSSPRASIAYGNSRAVTPLLLRARRLFASKTADPGSVVVFGNALLNKMRTKLEGMKAVQEKLLHELNDPACTEAMTAKQFAETTKQLHDLTQIRDKYDEVVQKLLDLQSLEQLLSDPVASQDKDLVEMTKDEIRETRDVVADLEKELLITLLPKDSADEANALLEIRAGTGGDEAGLFAADILRMYERFAETQGWRWEVISYTHDGLGAIKDATVSITGTNVFGQLKFESGVHRVQRVPATETQGRIHTSTITVAIMPQPTEVQVQINDSDVRVDVFRASGSGGQKVNTTDSAIRLTHLPTGIVVAIQDERSNQKNRAKAFTILRAKLFDLERERLANERRDSRRKQVGSGTRSEKIRTYNFPQNRVTDHRINKTLHELESVLNGEALLEFVQALRLEEQAEMLMAMNEEA